MRRPATYRRPFLSRFSPLAAVLVIGFFFILIGLLQHGWMRDGCRKGTAEKVHRHMRNLHFAGLDISKIPDFALQPELPLRIGVNYTEEMLDPSSVTRQLRDQMALASAFVELAKEDNNTDLAWELSIAIRKGQALMSQAALTGPQIRQAEGKFIIRDLALLIHKGRELHYNSAAALVRLQEHVAALQANKAEANAQSAFLGQLAAEAVPKGLHCLGMRLTVLWAAEPALHAQADSWRQSSKLEDSSLQHFCIFSDNVIAVGVVVNSTVSNSPNPERLVFHIVTDHITLAAMQAWFSLVPPGGATIEVRDVAEFKWLNATYAPVLKQLQKTEIHQYYFAESVQEPKNTIKFRNPKYLSILNHLRFYLPEMYPHLIRVVFLDDDVVVQKDLGPLFSLDLHGNVLGAVETCDGTFHRFHKYLNFSHPLIRDNFDPEACGWAFGMNVVDLVAWRKADITKIYHSWQEKNVDRTLWKLGTLPPGLLSFYGLLQPLDRSWHVLGLGYNANMGMRDVEDAAVIHWNGNLKPWLKVAIQHYRPLWTQYLNYSQPLISECNFH